MASLSAAAAMASSMPRSSRCRTTSEAVASLAVASRWSSCQRLRSRRRLILCTGFGSRRGRARRGAVAVVKVG